MRPAHRSDLAVLFVLAGLTTAVFAYLTPSPARARALPPTVSTPAIQEPSVWTPGSRRRPARPAVTSTPTRSVRRASGETPSERPSTSTSPLEHSRGSSHFRGGTIFMPDDGIYYGHRWYPRRNWYRRSYRRAPRSATQRPVLSWVDASQGNQRVSLCELIPGLCGAPAPRTATALAAPSPELVEAPTSFTLRNDHVAIDIDRVGRCAVRVRRAEDHADTLLTFDTPDELVPCEARVIPDVLHDDGVSVELIARAPAWTQSMVVSLAAGATAPGVSIARAREEGAVTTHDLTNASSSPIGFVVDGEDLVASPGESITVQVRSENL